MRISLIVVAFLALAILSGCTPLSLRPADFAWPVEDVVTPDGGGVVHVKRYEVAFNVKAMLFDAVQDSVNVTKHELRLIRSIDGYYFITAKKFKDVYVFGTGDGALELKKKIMINEKGLEAPAFNQKKPYVQLVNENKESEAPILLTKDGIYVPEGGKK